jgi:hypothetical protein
MTTIESEPYDDFETEVLPLRRRPRLSRITALLAGAAIAAAAFMGGVEIQKHYGSSSASAAAASPGGANFRAAAASRFGGAPQKGGGFGRPGGGAVPSFGGAGGAGVATGLVTLIRGSTLYVTDFSGNTIKVETKPGLQVTKSVTSSVKGIHPGDSIVVQATKAKDGTYKATSITVNNG